MSKEINVIQKYENALIEFKEEVDIAMDEHLAIIRNTDNNDDFVTQNFIYEILKNLDIKEEAYLSGSALLYLADNTLPKPNDIDIYINIGAPVDCTNFIYKKKYITFKKIPFSYFKNFDGISNTENFNIFVDEVKLNLSVQFIFVNEEPEDFIERNDLDICRFRVNYTEFENLKDNIDEYVKFDGRNAKYLPQPNYFVNFKGHTILDSYRLIRIHKYIEKGFDIYYNDKLINKKKPRISIDKYIEKHAIDLLKDEIIIELNDLVVYKGMNKFVNKLLKEYLKILNDFSRELTVIKPNTRKYFVTFDYVRAYIKACEIREHEKNSIESFTPTFDVTNSAKTLNYINRFFTVGNTLPEMNEAKIEYSVFPFQEEAKNPFAEIVNKYMDINLIESIKITQEQKKQNGSGTKRKNFNYVINILQKIMKNKNMFITGGAAAHMINPDLPLHDIDIYFSEDEMFNFDANIFETEEYYAVKSSFCITSNKNISTITNIYLMKKEENVAYFESSQAKTVENYFIRRFKSAGTLTTQFTNKADLKIQFIATTINPIDVIMGFDFGASKCIIRSVEEKFEDISMPIYKEMVMKKYTTYNIIMYNTFEFNDEIYLNKDSARRLAKYFFRGFTIDSTRLKARNRQMKHTYGNLFTLSDILTTLYLSCNDISNHGFYELDKLPMAFNKSPNASNEDYFVSRDYTNHICNWYTKEFDQTIY